MAKGVQYGRKLLLYLNPDPADMGSMALYLYGKDDDRRRKDVLSIVNTLRGNGWEIIRKAKHYTLSERHWRLVQANKQAVAEWVWRQTLSPEAVGREGKNGRNSGGRTNRPE